MRSGIEAEAGDIEQAGDIEEHIGEEADGATEIGVTDVAGATCSDGPIDLIVGSIASMDVHTGRRVARPFPAGGGRATAVGGGDLGDLARDEKISILPFETKSAGAEGRITVACPKPDALW
jgi:hypothetical protein